MRNYLFGYALALMCFEVAFVLGVCLFFGWPVLVTAMVTVVCVVPDIIVLANWDRTMYAVVSRLIYLRGLTKE